jgi:ribosomal protein S18 acetylase RimI-like enzyme
VTIRPRREEDVQDLVRVAARVRDLDGYPPFLPGDDFHSFLTEPAPLAAWVADSDNSVVGHVALNGETHPGAITVARDAGVGGDLGVVARLFVDPAVRRRGYGKRLLQRAVREAVAQGRAPILDVHATAASAIALYRSGGWQELGRCELAISGEAPIEEVIFGLGHGEPGLHARDAD